MGFHKNYYAVPLLRFNLVHSSKLLAILHVESGGMIQSIIGQQHWTENRLVCFQLPIEETVLCLSYLMFLSVLVGKSYVTVIPLIRTLRTTMGIQEVNSCRMANSIFFSKNPENSSMLILLIICTQNLSPFPFSFSFSFLYIDCYGLLILRQLSFELWCMIQICQLWNPMALIWLKIKRQFS